MCYGLCPAEASLALILVAVCLVWQAMSFGAVRSKKGVPFDARKIFKVRGNICAAGGAGQVKALQLGWDRQGLVGCRLGQATVMRSHE